MAYFKPQNAFEAISAMACTGMTRRDVVDEADAGAQVKFHSVAIADSLSDHGTEVTPTK
jgi:hypothetical protein